MADSINFRTLEARDLPSQKELFQLCFPETVGSAHHGEAYRAWKFQGVPSTPPSREFIAEVEGALNGYYAALPLEYKVGGARARVALVVDVMVHPRSQGQGVFRKLGLFSCAQLKAEGFDFTTGYPIRPQVMPGHIKVGWKIAFPLPTYVAVLSSKSVLESKDFAWAYALVEPFVKVQSWLVDLGLAFRGRGYRIETVESLPLAGDASFWDFQERWLSRQTVAWARTPKAWTWRLSRPASKYHSVLARDRSGRIVGHALATPTVLKDVTTLAVLDIQTTDAGAVPALQRGLRALARRFGRDTLSAMAGATFAARNGFMTSGFLKTDAVFKLIINNLSGAFADAALHEEKNWHVSWLDSDDV